jgi:hypothetical protein
MALYLQPPVSTSQAADMTSLHHCAWDLSFLFSSGWCIGFKGYYKLYCKWIQDLHSAMSIKRDFTKEKKRISLNVCGFFVQSLGQRLIFFLLLPLFIAGHREGYFPISEVSLML